MKRRRIPAFLLALVLPILARPALAHEAQRDIGAAGSMSASAQLAFRIVIPERLLLPTGGVADDGTRQALLAPGARRVTEIVDGRVVTTVAAP